MTEKKTQTIDPETLEKAYQAYRDADRIISIRVVEHYAMPKFKVVRNGGPSCPGF